MWTLLVFWIIIFVDGRVINECHLVLHALSKAVCHLHLALLSLRHAPQHFIKAARHVFTNPSVNDFNNMKWRHSTEDRHLRKACAGFLEGVCLLCECLCELRALVSSVCVAFGHGLQGALYLLVSTARGAQNLLLPEDHEDEWVKELKQQRERLQKQRRQVEKIPMRC